MLLLKREKRSDALGFRSGQSRLVPFAVHAGPARRCIPNRPGWCAVACSAAGRIRGGDDWAACVGAAAESDFAEQESSRTRIEFHRLDGVIAALMRIAVIRHDELRIGTKEDRAGVGVAGALKAAAREYQSVMVAQILRQRSDELIDAVDGVQFNELLQRVERQVAGLHSGGGHHE